MWPRCQGTEEGGMGENWGRTPGATTCMLDLVCFRADCQRQGEEGKVWGRFSGNSAPSQPGSGQRLLPSASGLHEARHHQSFTWTIACHFCLLNIKNDQAPYFSSMQACQIKLATVSQLVFLKVWGWCISGSHWSPVPPNQSLRVSISSQMTPMQCQIWKLWFYFFGLTW